MTDLVERARFLAAGQDDPHSVTITELCDKIEGLEADLDSAVGTAWRHGARDWVSMNHPTHAAILSTQRRED